MLRDPKHIKHFNAGYNACKAQIEMVGLDQIYNRALQYNKIKKLPHERAWYDGYLKAYREG
jgi:translation elongation factor EF-Tu-like GTPase